MNLGIESEIYLQILTAASIFAGDVMFGSFNNEITDNRTCSTPNTGLHLVLD